MRNKAMEERILEALQKQEPLPPIEHELGGSPYYTCHWLNCSETVNRFMDYCPKCGQRIDWSMNND